MARYFAFLEGIEGGLWMAHVLDLPGCFLRASSRDEVLSRLPGAVHRHLAWLRRHGEVAPPEGEPIQIELSEEQVGIGPFISGDAAALFTPESLPIVPTEMEDLFRLMAHSRADLLDLVRDLPDAVLDWQPDRRSRCVRRILRHVGNAEEWYVSRLVPPDTLPPEWAEDEEMPIWEFLEMERRTAVERLRRLDEQERSSVSHPTNWTDHPEEGWTARKALRRFLEHEREHLQDIRETLEFQRRHLLSRLAAARGELLAQLLGLDRRALVEIPVLGDWTLKDVLAHVAAWDRWVLSTLQQLFAGGPPDVETVRDIDGYNAANVAAWRDRSLEEVISELGQARVDWVAWMESLPVEHFFRRRPVGRGDWFPPTWIQVFEGHDGEHAEEIAEWAEEQGLQGESGPKPVIGLVLAGARDELLAAAAMVPAAERDTRPVCGTWTLRDLLGHVADWEWYGADALRHMAGGRSPEGEADFDLEAWNQAHVQARRGQFWEEVWSDLHAAHAALLEALEGLDPADLARPYTAPWNDQITPYTWLCIYVEHDREHARDLRSTMMAEAGPAGEVPAKTWTTRGG